MNDDPNDQLKWWENVYLPLLRRMQAGEYVHPWLLAGGLRQANDDETWDQRHADS